jgi:hypothetical protein
MSRLRLEVDAAAAKPQREGDSQESWSRPGWPLMRNTPPLSTTWARTVTTISGIVLSEELTTEEIPGSRRCG